MYPAGGVATFRTPKGTKDVVLGGGRLVVPPGVGLHMPITAVHHSKDLWEDPQDFKPERFFEVRTLWCSFYFPHPRRCGNFQSNFYWTS